MRRRIALLPLHGGQAPAWLFRRMRQLAGAITMAVVDAFGAEEMLRRLADPWWFQAFGCVLGFDWHSSGLTTVTCGAMKEARRTYGDEMGIIVAGGKGAVSRKTPRELADAAERYAIAAGDRLIYASRMSAKVDSAAVQDGYQLYHHSFFLTPSGAWCVVQQGMSDATGLARRYHWLGETVDDFICEPHSAIADLSGAPAGPAGGGRAAGGLFDVLNMVAREADANRRASAGLVRGSPDRLLAEARKVAESGMLPASRCGRSGAWPYRVRRATEGPMLFAPAHHAVLPGDVNLDRLGRIVRAVHEAQPADFEALLGAAGVGPAAIRALSLMAELIYDAPASRRDPATPLAAIGARTAQSVTGLRITPDGRAAGDRHGPEDPAEPVPAGPRRWADYSYAHGGKDGHPFPVDRRTYDQSIHILLDAVRKARIGETDKADALKRLAGLVGKL